MATQYQADPWDSRRKPDEASGERYLPSAQPSATPSFEQPEPTRGHKACIAELSLRFPCPAHTDGDDYRARLDLLTRDTSHLAPGLLRKACDLASQAARGLPYASEILNAAALIVEERQRQQRETQPASHPGVGDKGAAYFRGNVTALARDQRLMMTAGGDYFMLGDLGERRGVRGDGSVIEPWFHHGVEGDPIQSGWYCRREDAHDLAACYARYESAYRLSGARIVEA